MVTVVASTEEVKSRLGHLSIVGVALMSWVDTDSSPVSCSSNCQGNKSLSLGALCDLSLAWQLCRTQMGMLWLYAVDVGLCCVI